MRVALNIAGFMFLLVFSHGALADDLPFTNSLVLANAAERRGDLLEALNLYDVEWQNDASNAADMCVLSHCYCDLTRLTNSAEVQKDLVSRALVCAQRAVAEDPTNATAHASVAVCYAKSCSYVDIKTELAYSRLFKEEAEKAIALDPGQDVAYYLLGRWNYGIASAGLFSRAYVKVVYGGLPHASFQDAIYYFKKACDVAPNRILNHAGLAMAYEAIGDTKSEIAELKRCCTMKPLGPEDLDARQDAQAKLAALQ